MINPPTRPYKLEEISKIIELQKREFVQPLARDPANGTTGNVLPISSVESAPVSETPLEILANSEPSKNFWANNKWYVISGVVLVIGGICFYIYWQKKKKKKEAE